jgi:hypothetical protein
MRNRFRQFIESVLFAGLKPGGRSTSGGMRWLGPLRAPFERFLSGPSSADPLYLSNRTLGQKLKLAAVVAVPALLVAGGLMLALSSRTPGTGPGVEPTAAEINQRILPHLDKNIHVEVNRELEVMEVHIERTPDPKLACTVRNNTSHAIQNGEVVFDLTDSSGSQLGAVRVPMSLPASSTTKFQISIRQQSAAFALVREVRTL